MYKEIKQHSQQLVNNNKKMKIKGKFKSTLRKMKMETQHTKTYPATTVLGGNFIAIKAYKKNKRYQINKSIP